MLMSDGAAEQLFRRILPHIQREDYVNRIPLCFGHDGVWLPLGLNPCLKVVRYTRGGHFVEHRDGPWIPHEDQASIFTVVLYLNEGFVGGETDLMHQLHRHGVRRGCRGDTQVKPTCGTALFFTHDTWHAAQSVREGTKYILRTEMIFQRVRALHVNKNAFTSLPQYHALVAEYREAHACLEAGDRSGFFSRYQDVVEEQRKAMMRCVEARSSSTSVLSDLNDDELGHCLAYLDDCHIACLLLVSTGSYYRIVQSTVWQDKCASTYPVSFLIEGFSKDFFLRFEIKKTP